MKGIDWQHGDTVILARTDKGLSLLLDAAEAGYLVLKERNDFGEVLRGQKVPDRIKQVETYIKAIQEPTCYEAEVVKARHDIEQFKKRETLTKDEIVERELCVIRKAIFADKLSHSVLYRLFIKIKHMLE